jgi:hypothetical protein
MFQCPQGHFDHAFCLRCINLVDKLTLSDFISGRVQYDCRLCRQNCSCPRCVDVKTKPHQSRKMSKRKSIPSSSSSSSSLFSAMPSFSSCVHCHRAQDTQAHPFIAHVRPLWRADIYLSLYISQGCVAAKKKFYLIRIIFAYPLESIHRLHLCVSLEFHRTKTKIMNQLDT